MEFFLLLCDFFGNVFEFFGYLSINVFFQKKMDFLAKKEELGEGFTFEYILLIIKKKENLQMIYIDLHLFRCGTRTHIPIPQFPLVNEI